MKVKNYYLATIIHTGEPINVGFALEFDGTEKNPQAKVLAGARYSLQERLTKLGRDPEESSSESSSDGGGFDGGGFDGGGGGE